MCNRFHLCAPTRLVPQGFVASAEDPINIASKYYACEQPPPNPPNPPHPHPTPNPTNISIKNPPHPPTPTLKTQPSRPTPPHQHQRKTLAACPPVSKKKSPELHPNHERVVRKIGALSCPSWNHPGVDIPQKLTKRENTWINSHRIHVWYIC